MTRVAEPRDDEFATILASTNAAYASFKQEGDESTKYEGVSNPQYYLQSHPQPDTMLENIYEIPCLPEHHQQTPAMDIPPVAQDGGEKDPDQDIYI